MKLLNLFKKTKMLCALPLVLILPGIANAHHGFGLYQVGDEIEYSGIITKINFVNPHSYLYFERVDESGQTIAMKCEMRAASLLRRSGWSKEMFVEGLPVTIVGNPHRDDPGACYIEDLTIGDRPTINRNDQFTIENAMDNSNRAARLASGELNISGDWGVEQLVLTIPPEGGNGSMVPKSTREAYASGAMSLDEIRALNVRNARPQLTARGQAEAADFDMGSPLDNPRLSCSPSNFIYDWTWDWPVNRIVQSVTAQGESVIDMDYGLYAFSRRIHVGMEEHPTNITRSNSGHSIAHWEGDILVVDTIGFETGLLSPPTRNSEQLHIVERYTLDNENMVLTRSYVATDPIYLAAPWEGSDKVLLSDVPFERQDCLELTPEFMQ